MQLTLDNLRKIARLLDECGETNHFVFTKKEESEAFFEKYKSESDVTLAAISFDPRKDTFGTIVMCGITFYLFDEDKV